MRIAKTIAILSVIMSLLLIFCLGISQWHLIDLPSQLNTSNDLLDIISIDNWKRLPISFSVREEKEILLHILRAFHYSLCISVVRNI